jgi:hypothetical protein
LKVNIAIYITYIVALMFMPLVVLLPKP